MFEVYWAAILASSIGVRGLVTIWNSERYFGFQCDEDIDRLIRRRSPEVLLSHK
jgi:hypothetical protein